MISWAEPQNGQPGPVVCYVQRLAWIRNQLILVREGSRILAGAQSETGFGSTLNEIGEPSSQTKPDPAAARPTSKVTSLLQRVAAAPSMTLVPLDQAPVRIWTSN